MVYKLQLQPYTYIKKCVLEKDCHPITTYSGSIQQHQIFSGPKSCSVEGLATQHRGP